MAIEVFTQVFENIDTTVTDTVAGGTANLLAIVAPAFQAVFIVYVMFVVWSYWSGNASVESTAIDLVKRIVIWGLVLGFSMNLGTYNSFVLPIVLGLGDGLSQAFNGTATSDASVLDALATQVLEVVNENGEEASELTMPFGLGAYINITLKSLMIMTCFALFLVLAAAYITLAKVFLAILAVLGPIFIGFLLFPSTRQYGMNWLNQVLNYSILLLLLNIVAGLFINYLNASLSGGLTDTVSNASLLHLVLSTLMMFVILMKLPDIASGLAGGVAANGFSTLAQVARGGKQVFGGKGGGAGSSGGSLGKGKPQRPESSGKNK